MRKTSAAAVVIALIGVVLPGFAKTASAATFTFVCEASTEPAPSDWFGGPWTAPVRLVIDTVARSVDLLDDNNRILNTSAKPARLSALNNYKLDLTVTESIISWGVIEMWGFSGYVDLRTGRLDVLWTNSDAYTPNTLTRQFHGTCTQR
jgi:hypothetical protein